MIALLEGMFWAQSNVITSDEFRLFLDLDEEEIIEIREYLDLKLDLSALDDFMEIVDSLNHFFE